jgi:indole-3-glycerol phosphate synthase
MSDILNKIVAVKHEEIAAAQQEEAAGRGAGRRRKPRAHARLRGRCAPRSQAGQAAVIAEIKKASPSKGVLREDFIPADIAQSYAEGDGKVSAACLSVLTDRQFFQGSPTTSSRPAPAATCRCCARTSWSTPTRSTKPGRWAPTHPADRRLPGRRADGRAGGLAHGAEHGGAGGGARPRELQRALKLKTPLVGINNRNLRTFEVSLQTTLDLLPEVPADRLLITESGILSRADVQTMRAAGVHAFLVGEAFMRAPDPGWRWPSCSEREAGRELGPAVPRRLVGPRLWRRAGRCVRGVSGSGPALLAAFLASGCQGATVYPPQPLRALALTPLPDAVRVVILGRTRTTARAGRGPGVFGGARAWPCRPACATSSRSCSATWACRPPWTVQPGAWAEQGVLLLNTCLTVKTGARQPCRAGLGSAHRRVIEPLQRARRRPRCSCCGVRTPRKRRAADRRFPAPVSAANHPSPAVGPPAPVPFIGCGHFGQANAWLRVPGTSADRWFAGVPAKKPWHNLGCATEGCPSG